MKSPLLIISAICCCIAGSVFATAGVVIDEATSAIGPSGSGSSASPDSSQVATVEAKAQMENATTPQQQNSVTTAKKTITVKASIDPNGHSYCPDRKGYATPQVNSYHPNGYAQCTYVGIQN